MFTAPVRTAIQPLSAKLFGPGIFPCNAGPSWRLFTSTVSFLSLPGMP